MLNKIILMGRLTRDPELRQTWCNYTGRRMIDIEWPGETRTK